MKKNEEIQMRCNMMGDYMSYVGEGEKEEDGSKETFNHLRKKMLEVEELYEKVPKEEDETRQPRPDEPEEYWKETQRIILMAEDIISKSQTILFYILDQKPSLYNKQLQQNLNLMGATMDNLIYKLRKEEVR
jgi:hypothetical protein